MNFGFEISENGDTVKLTLTGDFDELATLPSDFDFSKFTNLAVDFGGIRFINSGGIKLWVNFISDLSEQDNLKITFHKCRRIIVDQINLIEGFLPRDAEVGSVYIPVFCGKCEKSFDVFQDMSKFENMADAVEKTDNQSCENYPRCKKHLEADLVAELFFKFRK